MSDFKAKMQIRFPLGLCPRTQLDSLHRSIRPLTVWPTSTGGREGREEVKGEKMGWMKGGLSDPVGDSGSGSGWGERREKSKEWSLCRGSDQFYGIFSEKQEAKLSLG